MHSLMRRLTLLAICSLLTALLACGGSGSELETEGGIRSEGLAAHMQEHFVQAKAIQEAVIDGDLEGLKSAAQWVADHQAADSLPEGWEPYVTEMQGAARQALEATDVATAASAAATIAENCGSCHLAVGARPLLVLGDEPPQDPATVPHMLGHLWGADRMWEGLIVPSDVAWANGVAPLAGDPLQPENLSDHAESSDDVRALAIRVHELAAAGREAEGQEARAAIYGEFIATCAACHQMLGIGG
jgi:cytochrome c553